MKRLFQCLCVAAVLALTAASQADASPKLGIDVREPSTQVTNVYTGSAAEKSGVKVGDIIFMVNGVAASTYSQLAAALAAIPADETFTLKVLRGGQMVELKAWREEYSPPPLKVPDDYPAIRGKTTLSLLTDMSEKEAKAEIGTVEKFVRTENKVGYLLGTKGYNDFAGKVFFGAAMGKTNLNFVMVTPYSAVRYLYWTASKQFKPVDADSVGWWKANPHVVCVMVAPESSFGTNVMEGLSGYVGLKYEAVITNVVVRKQGMVYQNIRRDGMKWYFPIDLFNTAEDIEVIAVDADNEQKIIKLSTERLAEFK